MTHELLNFEIDHLETIGRKKGVLFVQKGYHRSRDLILTLIESLDRNVVLISTGRSLSKMEEMHHPNLRSIIRINGNEPSGLMNWSDDLDLFQYVTPSIERALQLTEELAQRGDIVLFSPFGTRDEVYDWYKIFKKHSIKFGLSV